MQSTEKVLILEYMDGVRLNDAESLRALGVDKQKLVEEITRAYGHQIFVDGFFNGDPHPGTPPFVYSSLWMSHCLHINYFNMSDVFLLICYLSRLLFLSMPHYDSTKATTFFPANFLNTCFQLLIVFHSVENSLVLSKPGNFLVSKEPPHRPILLDFGLTKLLSSSLKQALAKMFLAAAEVCPVPLTSNEDYIYLKSCIQWIYELFDAGML